MSEAAKIMAEVLRLAKEFPEKIYCNKPTESCLYTKDSDGNIPGQNGCIFGIALYNLYKERFLDVVKKNEDKENGTMLEDIFKYMKLDIDKYETRLFRYIQALQDSDYNWRQAVYKNRDVVKFIFQYNEKIIGLVESI